MAEVENWQRAGFGLYIHWPFCLAKCPYCDFNSHVADQIDTDRWCRGYVSELRRIAALLPDRRVRSVFFGGGTPSLMDPRLVETILNEIRALWSVENRWEVTLEANPTSVEAENFAAYRQAGVNRLSLGIQALNNRDLQALGRTHSVDEALAALDVSMNAFDRVSFDLIYARQGQSLQSWLEELERAMSFGTEHLSLYQLTIEPGTVFGRRFEAGRLTGLPNEDLSAEMFEATQARCAEAGLSPYEVSNYAKIGQESLHNLIYWQGGDYAGIGPGAHGRYSLKGARFATEAVKAPSIWLEKVESGQADTTGILERADMLAEYLMMGLRLRDGIDRDRLLDLAADNPTIDARIADLSDQGLLREDVGTLAATERGRLLLNSVVRELLGE